MSFRPFNTEIDRILKAPGGPVGRHMNSVSRSVAAEARKVTAERGLVRTGRYQRGFKVEVYPDARYGFYFLVVNRTTGQKPRRNTSYAAVIEHGSRPHLIRPRAANKWLVFRMPDGRMVKTKLVSHPGTAPQNVLGEALDRVGRSL